MNSKNIFAYILSGLVLFITIMSLMAIWGIVQWQAIENIFFNTAKSLVVITISAIVIYLIQSLLLSKETNAKHQEQKSTS